MIARKLHLSLLILDEPNNAQICLEELKRGGIEVTGRCVPAKEAFLAALKDSPDLILAGAATAGRRIGGREALSLLRERRLSIPVVVLAGPAEEELAAELLGLGAAACLPRNELSSLAPAVVRAHFERKLELERPVAENSIMPLRDESRRGQSALEAVWHHSTDAMRLTNREGIIHAVNATYCKMVAMSEEELVGQPFTIVYPEERDHAELRARYSRSFHEGVPVIQQEGRTRFRRGRREIDVEVSIMRMPVESGEELLLTVIRDISERKRMEAQFLRSQRMECIGALAGGIAHDFNNILAPIMMASSMLRLPLSRDDRDKALSTVEESGRRGADIVRRLLLFARGIEGERKPLQPGDLLREVAAIVDRSFPRNIDLEAHIPSDLWNVAGDGTQLHQVLLNLCVNARDAMPEGGRLRLEARNEIVDSDALPSSPHARSGSFVALVVADTGAGIPAENLNNIFDPFFSTKVSDGGTGLGLSTSLSIVKSHSGFITAENEEGGGARFTVYLPASVDLEAPRVEPRVAEARENGRGEVILVVEDEAAVGDVMIKILRNSGYQALLERNGAEALETLAADRNTIGLIVSDLSMPRMGGLEFLRLVREKCPQLPAIAMSGNADQSLIDALHQLGVTEVIEKPFDPGRLLKAIRATLGEAKPG